MSSTPSGIVRLEFLVTDIIAMGDMVVPWQAKAMMDRDTMKPEAPPANMPSRSKKPG